MHIPSIVAFYHKFLKSLGWYRARHKTPLHFLTVVLYLSLIGLVLCLSLVGVGLYKASMPDIVHPLMTDTTPRALFYAGFNGGQISQTTAGVYNQGVGFDSNGKIQQGMRICKGTTGCNGNRFVVSPTPIDPRRGTITFWIRLNTLDDGYPVLFSIQGGSPNIQAFYHPNRSDPNDATKTLMGEVDIRLGYAYNTWADINSKPFNFVTGDWHNVVWTWEGMRHKMYIDGQLSADVIAKSPMPYSISPDDTLYVGADGNGLSDATIDELTFYNYAMNSSEAAAAYTNTNPAPITSSGAHGLGVVSEWGPSVGKVHIAADAGNDFELQAASYKIDITKNGASFKSGTLTKLNRGFAEGLVDLGGGLNAGNYQATISLLNSSGATLTSQQTSPFSVPSTPWLGANIGVSDQVQPPWTPIVVNGTTLSVWGRTYDLSGGFGFPQQITSKGQPLLAQPVDVDFDAGSGVFHLSPQSVTITSAAPNKVTWTGKATGGGISATVTGSLEYDGMMLVTLTLSPVGRAVAINTMKLQTVVPSSRALYYAAAGDNPFWWHTRKTFVPAAPGTFTKDLDEHIGFMPSIVFSDDDRGLEWFAENQSGWQIDINHGKYNPAVPTQELIRDAGGTVRIQNNIGTRPFTLSQPISITFGYEAIPIKSIPAQWRLSNFGDTPGGADPLRSTYHARWSWPDDGFRRGVWPSFRTSPGISPSTADSDLETYTSRVKNHRANCPKCNIAPYYDQHVTIPSGVDAGTGALDFLNAENLNDGWYAHPTPGTIDYWMYNVKRTMDAGGMDAIYIDEPFTNSAYSANLLTGEGYIAADGTHRPGYNLLGIREQLKRLRQVQIDHGKTPVVWIHSTANMQPHMWAFVDVVSDGESFLFTSPTDPDWIDVWGNSSGTGLPWLFSIGRTEKFGMTPAFLDEIRFSESTYPMQYVAAFRAMTGLLQLMDIVPIGKYNAAWHSFMQPRFDFGMAAPDVIFHPYWTQTAITTDNASVKSSYWSRATSTLAVVTNLSEAYSGTVTVDLASLGLTGAIAIDAESKQPLAMTNGAIALSIPRHDYRLIQFVLPIRLKVEGSLAQELSVDDRACITSAVAKLPNVPALKIERSRALPQPQAQAPRNPDLYHVMVEIDVSVAGQSSTHIFNCIRHGQLTVIQPMGMR
jgi:Glycoside hydrolase 123, N-terminal domain/Concanavalin A-like lectin/glucanases superfamily